MLERKVLFAVSLAAVLFSGCSNNSDENGTPATQPPQATTPDEVSTAETVVLERSAVVAGPDSDRNGVRDDIDKLIKKLAPAEDQKLALTDVAKSYQDMLIKGQDKAAAMEVFDSMEKSIRCLYVRTPKYHLLAKAVYAATVNTEQRYAAAVQFQKNLTPRVDEFDAPSC